MSEPRVGDRSLVDSTAYDAAMRVRDPQNFAGVLVALGPAGLRVRRDASSEVLTLEAALGNPEEAEPREYWLRSTGEGVARPDWLAEWTQHETSGPA